MRQPFLEKYNIFNYNLVFRRVILLRINRREKSDTWRLLQSIERVEETFESSNLSNIQVIQSSAAVARHKWGRCNSLLFYLGIYLGIPHFQVFPWIIGKEALRILNMSHISKIWSNYNNLAWYCDSSKSAKNIQEFVLSQWDEIKWCDIKYIHTRITCPIWRTRRRKCTIFEYGEVFYFVYQIWLCTGSVQ